jgi:hypothetical protein
MKSKNQSSASLPPLLHLEIFLSILCPIFLSFEGGWGASILARMKLLSGRAHRLEARIELQEDVSE